MIIYTITNKVNKKVYVGQTVRTLKERKQEHCRKSRKSLISKAIKKYGIENFVFKQIDDADTIEKLNDLEIKYIKKYNSMIPNGYNACFGGNNKTGVKYTKETREKMSEDRKGKYTKENNHFYGKKHTEETREKMRNAWKTRKPNYKGLEKAKLINQKKVYCVELDMTFESVTDAGKYFNLASTNVSRACREDNNRKVRGYTVKYII